jgi:hypothetical protein
VPNKTFNVVGMCASISACATAIPPKPSAPLVSTERRALISIVAEDFASNPDCAYGTGSSGIVVDSTVVSSRGMVSDVWLAEKFEPEIWAQVAPLARMLRDSNPSNHLVDWGLEERSGLAVRDLSSLESREVERLASTVRCFATFMLPAVSLNGEDALVGFYVGPSPHGAVAFYALKRDASGWRVAARRFVHFL